jgi:ribosomal protein L29
METKDLNWMRGQNPEALKKVLAERVQHLHTLRFQLSANQLKTVREVRQLRQEIARLKTVLRNKQKTTPV